MICYRGLRFPQKAVVLLALEEGAAACTSLNGHCVKWPLCKKKCSVGFSMMLQSHRWYRIRLWRYWLPERCIKQWCDKPTGDGYLCKKCGLGEELRSEIAVSRTLSKYPYVQYANTNFRNISDQCHLPDLYWCRRQLCASFTVLQLSVQFVRLSYY